MPRPEYDFDPQEPWPASVRGCLIGGLLIPACLIMVTAVVSPDDYDGPCGPVAVGIILGATGYVVGLIRDPSRQSREATDVRNAKTPPKNHATGAANTNPVNQPEPDATGMWP